jgi:DNA polymerase III delta subunit
MIIFLYGKDSYRRQKRLNKIVEEYRNKYSNLSLDYFDLDPSTGSGQDELLRLKEFGTQMLIFDNKKLAILRNASAADMKDLREFLKTYLNAPDLTILISQENSN